MRGHFDYRMRGNFVEKKCILAVPKAYGYVSCNLLAGRGVVVHT